jgi:hypothetical protein
MRSRTNPSRNRPPAFTLIELMLGIGAAAVLAGLLLPALGQARASARTAVCESNMKQFGVATFSYAADYRDRIYSFSWKADTRAGDWPDLHDPSTDVQAAANQAVDIIRRRAGRPDIPRVERWLPHLEYSPLVLQDYLAQRLPEPMFVCPDDEHRLNWQRGPAGRFDRGAWLPFQPDPEPRNKPAPYSSGYQLVPAAYDANPAGRRLQPATHARTLASEDTRLGGRTLAQVRFPSGKVQLMDSQQRHAGRQELFYAVPGASQPLLFFDGSVRGFTTADANKGWQPNNPASPEPSIFEYTPRPWEAPTSTGEPSEFVVGHYRWTRAELTGVDFGGPEPR